MGNGEWVMGNKNNYQLPILNSQFPIPNAQCPLPNSQFPIHKESIK
ncbi:MAG: histidine kinase [Tolypothrix carrinoi HA7290-LM1]|nr:histidine kinase [Tolypothrix carrinoi HA7290-LM1]